MRGLAILSLAFASAQAVALPAPTVWSAPPISTEQFESHPAFDPRTGDLWFVRSTPEFRGWRLKVSRCTTTGWSAPADPPLAGNGVEADPWFSPDGRTLWFISSRTTDGVKGRGIDIWRATRGRAGRWSTPERLPEPINSPGNEWYPRVDRDGWLYFGSDRPGGFGKTDIWRARAKRGRWMVENAGPNINSDGDEYEALPNPDGKWLLLSADGYYRSERAGPGWSKRVRLGREINANGSEIGAAFSPSGRSWLFARSLDDGRSGELLLVGKENWPKPCPRR
ncbi:MAG: TolB family protein [Sphingomicrobium sp.]